MKNLLIFIPLLLAYSLSLYGMEESAMYAHVRDFVNAQLENVKLNSNSIPFKLHERDYNNIPFDFGWQATPGSSTIMANKYKLFFLEEVIKTEKNKKTYRSLLSNNNNIILNFILQSISVDDIPHPDAKTMSKQEIILNSAAIAVRHEVGHICNKDHIRDFLYKVLLIGTLWAIEKFIFGSTILKPNWKMVARVAAEATVARGFDRMLSRRMESQTDDFAIVHTKNSRELLAAAIIFKNYDTLERRSSLVTKFGDIYQYVFATHPGHYSRYKKFYEAAGQLYSQQSLKV